MRHRVTVLGAYTDIWLLAPGGRLEYISYLLFILFGHVLGGQISPIQIVFVRRHTVPSSCKPVLFYA